jgi:hypothetical protein
MRRRRARRPVRIFLASPGDVIEERQAAREVLRRLERSPLIREDFTIEVVSWDDPDSPVPMLAALTPQQAVSHVLPRPSECDITVVIVSGRMGTPLTERKPDGTPYLSGTEWEFEDAMRAGRSILIYRRTISSPSPGGAVDEGARQLQSVERFFSQFNNPDGTLKGGVTTYRTVDELASRLRTDIETLLHLLSQSSDGLIQGPPPLDRGWAGRMQERVRHWPRGRLLLVLVPGVTVSFVAWTAFYTFSIAAEEHAPSAFAYVIRYLVLAFAAGVAVALLVLTWWWFGHDRRNQSG